MVHFDSTAQVHGVRLEEVSAVAELSQTCSEIVVCGGASMSSWDDRAADLKRDLRLLPKLVRLADEAEVRLTCITSDAVFAGPWVFHDEESRAYSHSPHARRLRSIEDCVLKSSRNLVVRTNALSNVSGSWLSQLRQSFRQQAPRRINAGQFATPLAAGRVALLLDHILMTPASGIVHLAGAERLNAWSFALELARAESVAIQNVVPSTRTVHCERSLRCTRAKREFKLRMPTLSQTVAELTADTNVAVRRAA